MKFLNYLLAFAIAIMLLACESPREDNNTVVLSGKIENPNSPFVVFKISDLPDFYELDTVFLNDDGSFKTRFEPTQAGPAILYDGKESTSFYICPGDSLYITLNTESFDESLEYTGKGAEKNNFMAEYYLMFSDFENENFVNFYAINDTIINVFVELADKKEKDAIAFFNKNKSEHSFCPAFDVYMETEIVFSKTQNLMYRFYNKNLDTTAAGIKERDDVRNMIISAHTYENPDPMSRQYQSWLKNNLPSVLMGAASNELRGQKFDRSTLDSIVFIRIQEYISPQEFQQYIYGKVEDYAYDYDIIGLDALMPVVDQYITDPKIKAKIDQEYAEVVRKTSQGLPEDALLFNLDDEELLGLSFDDVLAKYKGNVIYLDFWASWCGPCKAEMPNSAALSKKLADEDVVFLYTSTDKNADDWVKMIKILQLHGLHYRLGENTRKPVFETYGIQFIPHYVLFDKEGNMVKNNMSRPGDPETEKMIMELLK
jgi:thiol-disulfide isomerase/thioredoxin